MKIYKQWRHYLCYTGCPENRDKYFGTWFGTPKEGKKL